jgi:acyl-homoserine lactone acylase PvdQ
MSRFSRGVVVAVAAALALPVAASAKDFAATALDIAPPGQYGSVPIPAAANEQAEMFDDLTPLFDQVTDGDLVKDFKSERLGTSGSCPCRSESVPQPGIKIVRDRFDVPHITGRNRLDLDWAAGWVAAEDRGLLLAEVRYPGRLAALDVPGVNAFTLVTELKSVTVSKQGDRIIDREQTAALKAHGAEGRSFLRDTDHYLLGLNARLKHDRSAQKPWTRVDIYSVNALAGQLFGQGGGDEARRSQLLSGLRARLGAARGSTVFDDLSEHLDADTPTSIPGSFPYEKVPADPSGNAIIDEGSLPPAAVAAATRMDDSHLTASNFLMVTASHSATGHPLMVGGPQIGFFYPGLLMEMDLHAPGIDARGAALPGSGANLLVGRGADYGWSLTSAQADTNDQFAETLCGGSDVKYLYDGTCRTMGRVDAGSIAGQGTVSYRTTVHGPVLGYGTSGGKRVALTLKRSSRGQDVIWQLMFRRLTDGAVTGLRSFYRAVGLSPLTFNVGYVDDRNVAMMSAGRLPIRDPRVDPRLPTIGTGQDEWKGFLPTMAHPHAANPASGTLVSWNNKPAQGFGSSDSLWLSGSIQRVQMLDDQLARYPKPTMAQLVSAMNAAATQDLRVEGSMLPAVAAVLAGSTAPSARSQQMLDLLLAWRASGSSRLDRDGDGTIDAGAAATIIDHLYPRIADAVLSPVLGPDLLAQLTTLEGANDSPNVPAAPGRTYASGFVGGRIAYVDKDLRELTGTHFASPFATHFCGNGELSACQDSLWQAFEDTGAELASAQGPDDPSAWTSDANAERIQFAPGLLTTTLRYANRPSAIQQVLSFSGHRKARD